MATLLVSAAKVNAVSAEAFNILPSRERKDGRDQKSMASPFFSQSP
jgi:hypothetical protein